MLEKAREETEYIGAYLPIIKPFSGHRLTGKNCTCGQEKKTYVPVSVLGLTDCGQYFTFSKTISLSAPRNSALVYYYYHHRHHYYYYFRYYWYDTSIPNKWGKMYIWFHVNIMLTHYAQQKHENQLDCEIKNKEYCVLLFLNYVLYTL